MDNEAGILDKEAVAKLLTYHVKSKVDSWFGCLEKAKDWYTCSLRTKKQRYEAASKVADGVTRLWCVNPDKDFWTEDRMKIIRGVCFRFLTSVYKKIDWDEALRMLEKDILSRLE